MDAIEKRASSALGKPEALHEWILVNKVQLDARIAAIKLLDKIDDGVDAYNAALSDTQALAEELLYAEVRLGKMLAAIDKKNSRFKGNLRGTNRGTTQETLPEGIDKRQSHKAQSLWKNEKMVPQVIEECREIGKVPVRREVFLAVAKVTGKTMEPRGPKNKVSPLIAIVDAIYAMVDKTTLMAIPQATVLGKLRELKEQLSKF